MTDRFMCCSLPAVYGEDVCKHCRAHKKWTTFSEYMSDVREFHNTIDIANKKCATSENTESHRQTWAETYIQIAKVVARRSKDPHTKVGAVLVKDGHVLGIGYNGEPRGFTLDFDWNSTEKYKYVIHAEMNAIANATSIGANVVGADIYLTLSPCVDCIKLLIQNRIKNVYFLDEYKDFEQVKEIAEHSDINLIKIVSFK